MRSAWACCEDTNLPCCDSGRLFKHCLGTLGYENWYPVELNSTWWGYNVCAVPIVARRKETFGQTVQPWNTSRGKQNRVQLYWDKFWEDSLAANKMLVHKELRGLPSIKYIRSGLWNSWPCYSRSLWKDEQWPRAKGWGMLLCQWYYVLIEFANNQLVTEIWIVWWKLCAYC